MTTAKTSARAAKRRDRFRRTTKPTDPRNRLVALLVVFVVIGAGFVAVLVDLQTVRPDRYRSLGENQRLRTRQIAGYRGDVVDRNGFVLAASTPSHQIVADPKMVVDPELGADPAVAAAALAPILGMEEADLVDLLTPDGENDRYSLLARDVGDEAVNRIQALEPVGDVDPLIGIFIRPEADRSYPAGDLAGGIVGRVDPDERGINGIEAQYDHVMTGVPGLEHYEQGRFGSISVGDWRVDPATAGYDVELTIDNRIQYVAEQTLIDHCHEHGANGATAVMSDVATGELLAVASVVRDGPDCVVAGYNTAVVDTYELGSVVKPLVVAAVSNELSYTADTLVEVPARLSVGGKTFEDHPPHPAAPFPISQVLANSMNVGTIVLSQQIAPELLHHYLHGFGLGRPTGLDVDGEAPGVLRHPDDWWGADFGSIPIGQGVTMNPTQLLAAYNTIANGGTYRSPTLVRSMRSAGGVVEPGPVADSRTVISATTAAEVTRALEAVVADGTGRSAAVPGYRVAGKTGTAWKVFDDGSGTLGYGSPGNRRYVVSFVGFLPADQPQISLAVIVDEPDGFEPTAATVAAPIFGELATYAVRILGIPPSEAADHRGDDGRVRGTPAPASPAATLPDVPVERDQRAAAASGDEGGTR